LTGSTVAAAWGGDEYGRGAVPIAATRTDDLGEYRLGGLPAGTIGIHLGGLPPPGIRGNTPFGRAVAPQVVTLDRGEERTGVDFALPRSLSPPAEDPVVMARYRSGSGITITGRIVSHDGRPLAGAQVMLLPSNDIPVSRVDVSDFIPADGSSVRPLATTFSDDSGTYELSGVSPGRYRVGARKPGYLPMGFDGPRSSESGRVIEVDGQHGLSQVDIVLPRLGAIEGRITDETGSPVEGATVSVVQARFEGGRRVLASPAGVPRWTDDRGRYRVVGLEPGRYVVRATPGSGFLSFMGIDAGADITGYTASFFPGTFAFMDAVPVDVAPSGEVTNLDFPLVRTATATVTGRIFTASGEPFRGRFQIAPRWERGLTATESTGAIIHPDGRFEFRNVVAGEYVISAYRGRNGSTEGEFGATLISVNGSDVARVTLTTSVGSIVRGSVTFEGSSTSQPDIEVSTLPVDADLAPRAGELASTRTGPDGRFALSGISGLRRLQVTRLPRGWTLKSISLNGTDVTDTPLRFGARGPSIDGLDVLLTNRLTEISGELIGADGRPVTNGAVVAFGVDRERWYPASRFLEYAPASGGTYAIRGLPPGEYFLAAVRRTRDLDDGAWQDRAILDGLAVRATRVTLAEEQRLGQRLQIAQ
jgi:protocatechuate 3,4-dioxygenase beta subunit